MRTRVRPCPAKSPPQQPLIQRAFIIGPVDDPLEQEADRAAESILRMPNPPAQPPAPDRPGHDLRQLSIHPKLAATPAPTHPIIQRQAAPANNSPAEPTAVRVPAEILAEAERLDSDLGQDEETEESEEQSGAQATSDASAEKANQPANIQAKRTTNTTPAISPDLAHQINNLDGRGQPLPSATRQFFEPRFGHDFSQVRIHASPEASELAENIHARAFTIGTNLVFGRSEYDPTTDTGKKLLAHELTHVIQQRHQAQPHPVQVQRKPKPPYDATILTADTVPEEKRKFLGMDKPALCSPGLKPSELGGENIKKDCWSGLSGEHSVRVIAGNPDTWVMVEHSPRIGGLPDPRKYSWVPGAFVKKNKTQKTKSQPTEEEDEKARAFGRKLSVVALDRMIERQQKIKRGYADYFNQTYDAAVVAEAVAAYGLRIRTFSLTFGMASFDSIEQALEYVDHWIQYANSQDYQKLVRLFHLYREGIAQEYNLALQKVPSDYEASYASHLQTAVTKLEKVGFGRAEYGMKDPVFGEERFDTKFWEIRPDPRYGRKLRLLEGKKASDAIDALFAKPQIWDIECAQFVQVAHLYALRHTLGAEQFDKRMETSGADIHLRQHASSGVKRIVYWERDSPGQPLKSKERPETKTVDDLVAGAPLGARIMWSNLRVPDSATRLGAELDFLRNENTFKLAPDQYAAHGFGKPQTFTREELEKSMAALTWTRVEQKSGDPSPDYIQENVFIKEIEYYQIL